MSVSVRMPPRRRVPLTLVALFFLCQSFFPSLIGSLQDFEGKVIEAVEFVGNQTLPAETLQYYLGIEPGTELKQETLNKNIRALWATQLIDDLEVAGEETEGGGLKLTVSLVERPTLRAIEYVGVKRINESDIDERIGIERIQLFEGGSIRRGELRRLEKVIEDLYREKGFRFADARYDLVPVEGTSEQRVVFTIDEGNRVRIEDIKFEGNTVYSDFRLQLVMKKTKQSNLLWRLTKKDIYNPAKLQEDLEAVKEKYREIGYKNITIGEPIIEVRAKRPNAATSDAKKRRMFVIIPVEEGERWKFGKVTVEGNEKYTDDQLRSVFGLRTGDWLRSKKLDGAVEAIEGIYKNTGYISAQVKPEVVEREDRIADVVLHVYEGKQFRVGRIDFQGNTRTRDKVLRREMRVHEGLVLSLKALENSLLKIRQLGYFNVNEEDPVNIVNVNEESQTIDLIIKGDEADRTELQFGGGWSEFDGFFVQLGLRTQNFMGRGESLGVSLQTGRVRNFFDVSYSIPWFLDRPQQVGVRIFDQETDFTLLSNQTQRRKNTGASFTYGRSFKLFQSLGLTYTISEFQDRQTFTQFLFDDDGNIVVDADGNPVTDTLERNFEFQNSSIRPVYQFNSIDHPFEPTRGTKFLASMDIAGGVLGGNQDFVRPELTYTTFRPVSRGRLKTVFGFNTQVGYILPYDGYQLAPFDRFYLGGENSVRGFSFRSIWARDENGNTLVDDFGVPLGGDRYFHTNLEYHFLTGGPFRVVLFADAGNVWADEQDIDFSNIRASAGIELRVTVPLFGAPLRFIYSQNLSPLPDDRFDSFDFTVGASF